MTEPVDVYRLAAERIWDDVTDRSGFSDDVDPQTRDEILETWADTIKEVLEGGE